MWLAPLDPRALLEARRYSVFDGHLVIEVTDLGGRAVRFAVEGNEQAAQCAVTDAAPDVSCSTAALGALLLGGNRWTQYAEAGLAAGARSRPARLRRRDVRDVAAARDGSTTGF